MYMHFEYDTREGIQAAFDDGLKGLNDLIIRRANIHKNGWELQSWVVLGLFVLDGGNVGWIEEAAAPYFRRHLLNEPLSSVMTYDEFRERHPECMLAFRISSIPKTTDVCEYCGRGWNIENVNDWSDGLHKSCRRLDVIEKTRKFFSFLDVPLQPIPNQYCTDEEFFGPWFIARTSKGPITIGWRKRVICIDWSQSDIKRNATELFTDNVTKGEKFIHA